MEEAIVMTVAGFALIVAGTLAVLFRRTLARWNAMGIRSIFGRGISDFVTDHESPIVFGVFGILAIVVGGFAAFAGLVVMGR